MSSITSLGFSIFSRFDGSGVNRANRSINQLQRNLNSSSSGLNKFTGRLSLMATAAAAIGPALTPIGAVLTGVAVAAAAVGAVSVGPMLLFGKVMKDNVTAVNAMAAAHKHLSPLQHVFVDNEHKMKVATVAMHNATMKWTLLVANDLVSAYTSALPKIARVVNAFGPVIKHISQDMQNWTRGSGLQRFVNIIVTRGVPALNGLRRAGKDVLTALGIGFRATIPLWNPLIHLIERGAAALRRWAQGGGFNRFIDGVRKNGPSVGEFFRQLARALAQVAKAMAGMGPLSLGITTGFLRMVAALPPGWIQVIVAGFLALKAAMAISAIVSGVSAALAFLSPILLGTGVGADFAAAGLAAMVWPILLVVAAIAVLTVGIFLLVKHWNAVWGGIKFVFVAAWNGIKIAAFAVWGALRTKWGWFIAILGPVGWLIAIAAHWKQVWAIIKQVSFAVWGALGVAFRATFHAMAAAGSIIWGGMRTAAVASWHGMSTAGRATWSGMRTAASAVWHGMASISKTVWSGMRGTASNIWHGAASISKTVWSGMRGTASTLWHSAASISKTVWSGLRKTASTLWHSTASISKTVWSGMRGTASNLWHGAASISKTVWSGLRKTASNLWHSTASISKTVWSGMRGTASNIWHGAASISKTVWSGLRKTASNIWHNTASIASSVFHSMARTLASIWRGITHTASSTWNALRKIVEKPIGFVVNHVIAPLVGVWNSIAGHVGLKSLRIPKPHVGFAGGGHVRGRGGPREDRIPAMLSNGEFVMNARAVKKYGLHTMHNINRRRFAEGGPVRLAKGGDGGGHGGGIGGVIGGVISGIGSGIKKGLGLVGKIKDWVLGALEKGAVWAVMKPFDALLDHMPQAGDTNKIVKAGSHRLFKGMLDTIMKKNDESGGGPIGGHIPKGARGALLRRALSLTHTPPPGSLGQWMAGLNTLITRESGWNAGAINRSDSNAAAGHPSQGLMQTIPGTFNAYALPGHHNIRNGLDNVCAGIRYIKARYGNITRVQQANAHLPPKGYARGGMVAHSYDRGGYLPPGYSVAYNGTGKPEPVGHGLSTSTIPVSFNDCTFVGSTRREWMDLFVKAHHEANRKRRI